jgi:hypothetical protein
VTAEWFDLGQRLHAADTRTPIARLHHAPISASPRPVAVRARLSGNEISVTAANPTTPAATATGPAALALLDTLGVTLAAPSPATLVTDNPATLALLHRLTLATPRTSPHDPVAAHIGWWLDRADFPGGRAVVDTISACRARWVTGTAPTAEAQPATWRRWLDLPDDSTTGLLTLHSRLIDGPPLRWLDVLAEDDNWSYNAAQNAYADGLDWRRPDTTARAALGLRSRCDAADLYAAAVLTDPLARRRAVHTGHVATGTAHPLPVAGKPTKTAVLEITCSRLDIRLRPGNSVTGWAGPADATAPTFAGAVRTSTVRGGHLILTLTGLTGSIPAFVQAVTLLPAAPSVHSQRRSRSMYRALYSARRSWLTTGNRPTLTRRPVPLDVLVAGAEHPDQPTK